MNSTLARALAPLALAGTALLPAAATAHADPIDYSSSAYSGNPCGTAGMSSHALDSTDAAHRGIFSDPTCDPRGLNHAVLAVGYGQENGDWFYVIK